MSAALLCAAAPSVALAADLDERIRKLENSLATQAKIIARQSKMLQQQQRELEALKTSQRRTDGTGGASSERQAERGAAAAPPRKRPQRAQPPPARSKAQAQPPHAGATSAPTEAPPRLEEPARPEVDVEPLVERGGVLTPPGTLVLEPQFEFVSDTSERVLIEGLSVLPAILVGNIDVRRVERESFFLSGVARYGVTDRFDADVKVPFTYRREQTTARDLAVQSTTATVSTVKGSGLGDIEAAGHYQINDGDGGWPFFIGNVRVKPPTGRDPFDLDTDAQGLPTELATGSGFWAVEPSLSFLMPSAPAVWFGNVKYLVNIERNIGNGFGTIDPGDSVGVTLGLAFAINPRTSFSLGWEYQYVFETTQNGQKIDGTDLRIGSGLLGMSYRVSDSVVLSLSVQGGFTEDASDFRLLFRVPVSFSLWSG